MLWESTRIAVCYHLLALVGTKSGPTEEIWSKEPVFIYEKCSFLYSICLLKILCICPLTFIQSPRITFSQLSSPGSSTYEEAESPGKNAVGI